MFYSKMFLHQGYSILEGFSKETNSWNLLGQIQVLVEDQTNLLGTLSLQRTEYINFDLLDSPS